MLKLRLLALASASLSLVCHAAAGVFADAVINYSPGTNFALGYTNPATALGQPTTSADPFDPPFTTNQIVSLGVGGSLTVQFDPPIINDPAHPYGLDLNIFGNSGFTIINSNYSGGGITDGSLFGNNTGSTLVSVSADGTNFYALISSNAPTVDGLFPTDGAGNFTLPVNPALSQTNFAGLGLAGIRSLYNGSAGGGSFALSWAQDTNGNSIFLNEISSVRVDVLSGKSEIDGLAAIAPPLFKGANLFQENFTGNPLTNGWKIFGDTNLFQWDQANQLLDVTWDSSQSNSYFYRPLGTILSTNDDFSLAFDLEINDITNTGSTFEISLGFLNYADATQTNFLRGTGYNSPNLMEFDYFLDPTYGPSISLTEADTNCTFAGCYDDIFMESNALYRVSFNHVAGTPLAAGQLTVNGVLFTAMPGNYISGGFGDFRVDTLAISSYNDAGSGATMYANGTIGHIAVVTPPNPVQNLTASAPNQLGQVQFLSHPDWLYALERSANFSVWSTASATIAGTGSTLSLQDTNPPASAAYYRVRASRP